MVLRTASPTISISCAPDTRGKQRHYPICGHAPFLGGGGKQFCRFCAMPIH